MLGILKKNRILGGTEYSLNDYFSLFGTEVYNRMPLWGARPCCFPWLHLCSVEIHTWDSLYALTFPDLGKCLGKYVNRSCSFGLVQFFPYSWLEPQCFSDKTNSPGIFSRNILLEYIMERKWEIQSAPWEAGFILLKSWELKWGSLT